MPTYEYVCDGCGDEPVVEQRITDEPLPECPTCGTTRPYFRRVISKTSFSLKGGGWAADGY